MSNKIETDILINKSITIVEDVNKVIKNRSTDSQHPLECYCLICKPLRFAEVKEDERRFKEQENLYPYNID